MSRFIPVKPEQWGEMVKAWAENPKLKAEVERLTAFTTRTIIPNEELQAQVERLTKAGDAMAEDLIGEFGSYNSVYAWNAAKEGKQS